MTWRSKKTSRDFLRSSGLPEEWQQQGVYVVLITEAAETLPVSCSKARIESMDSSLRFFTRSGSKHGMTTSRCIQRGEADEFEEVGFAPSRRLLATFGNSLRQGMPEARQGYAEL